jgi:hypothetical protein
MQQLKVSLGDDLRDYIETASAKAGHSLGEEIRQRLLASIADDHTDGPTRWLMLSVRGLAGKLKTDTGQDWHSHAGANRALRHALTALLERLRPKDKEAVFTADELPATRLVSSTDPEAIGLALEAVEFYGRPFSDLQSGPVSSLFQKSEGKS